MVASFDMSKSRESKTNTENTFASAFCDASDHTKHASNKSGVIWAFSRRPEFFRVGKRWESEASPFSHEKIRGDSSKPQIMWVIVGFLSCSLMACLGQFLYTEDAKYSDTTVI